MIAERMRPSALRVGDTFVHRPARHQSWLKPLPATTAEAVARPDAASVLKRIEVALQNFVQRYVHRPARNHSWLKSLTAAESAARPDATSVIKRLDRGYQDFVQRYVDPLFGDRREQQWRALSSTPQVPFSSEQEKVANRRLGLAAVNLGVAMMSALVYPPLLLATVPGILYLSLHYFTRAYHALRTERRVTIAVLDSLLVTWSLLAHFFLAATMGLFLINVSLKFLAKIKDKSQQKLIDVFSQHPRAVWILLDDKEIEIPFAELKIGDVVVVNAGEMVPVDGTIVQGIASIDQQALTGEAQLAEKSLGEQVLASTIVLSGRIHVRTEQAGQETVAAKIGEVLQRTAAFKTTLESKAERIVDQSTLPTLALSGLAYVVVGTSGALAILLTSIGYTMRMLAPLSTWNFLDLVSCNRVLIKDGSSLEKLTGIDTMIFDKTGTLTLEQPAVSHLYPANGFSKEHLLRYAAMAEYRQTHPIARAIVAAAAAHQLPVPAVDEAHYKIGYGVKVTCADQIIRAGSARFMALENIAMPAEVSGLQEECGMSGASLVMVAIDDTFAGAIAVQPTTRAQAQQVMQALRQQKIATYLISGDQELPTRKLAQELGMDYFAANILPKQKAAIVAQLQQQGKSVCFVGDGINDAIALQAADVSVSLRGATMAAIDTSQIVLMDEQLLHVPHLLEVGKAFAANQKTNLLISTMPGVICVGGVFLLHFGVYTAIALYYGGLALGIGNTMRPHRLAHLSGSLEDLDLPQVST